MKYLGIDLGSKTIGVAISDAFGWTAQGLTTIKWNESDIYSADKEMGSIIKENNAEKVIVGLPKNMDGSLGERAKLSEKYAHHIEKVHQLPTELWDERLSTMAAERALLEADMSRKKRKKVIDKVAAVMILQGYLDNHQMNRGV